MICPVCQSDKKRFLFTAYDILYRIVDDTFSLYNCQNCSAIFISPFPTQQETEKFYPKNYYSYNVDEAEGFFDRLKGNIIKSKMGDREGMGVFDKLLAAIFQKKFSGLPLYKKENGKFLDIGCGNGKNLRLLKKYGWDTYGIELDEKAVESAKKQGLKVEQSSLEAADFKGQKFDCIRIWHVFEHLTSPVSSIQKMKDLLLDDGVILMALPNTQSWARFIFGRYWYNLDVPRHVINYSPKTLGFLLKSFGMEIVEIQYTSCGAFVGSISNYLRHKFGYKGNLINNIFLVFLFYPIDFLSDVFRRSDIIFIKIKKNA